MRHIILHEQSATGGLDGGRFLNSFASEILALMGFQDLSSLHHATTEAQFIALDPKGSKRTLIEVRSQRDSLPPDTISKLLGNATLRGAQGCLLLSTSELSREDRVRYDEIRRDPALAQVFTWQSPTQLIELLIHEQRIVDPEQLPSNFSGSSLGSLSLICTPERWAWMAEILQEGLPTFFSLADAKTGSPVPEDSAAQIARISERYNSLKYLPWTQTGSPSPVASSIRAPVAPVVPGDAWEDLRPARPIDFVGRDDVIQEVFQFIENVRTGTTTTRTLSIQGPSGWGKSSLVLKLRDVSSKPAKGRYARTCSFTAIDSRSATNSSFVAAALQLALQEAAASGLISNRTIFEIDSLTHPLDSAAVAAAITELQSSNTVLVLVFDQFEELFAKESLFETFNAIRDLSIELDSRQAPIVLGFAWKTDVSLPQQHPAYHLWHELQDRRRDFRIRQFGTADITKVISMADRELAIRISAPLRDRLLEQCQGYPWLLKKLLVHVTKQLQTSASQYALLERELDVEVLFKEDLAGLKTDQLKCLKYVASRAPAYVSDVEENFRSETTNSLLSKKLLVRSGFNYVIYWDIFRDYLTDQRVPQIPWTRTFQRDPRSVVLALQAMSPGESLSARQVALKLNIAERSCLNILSDLVALQLVDRAAEDQYRHASHIRSTKVADIADHVHRQLARHVICRELATHDRDSIIHVEYIEGIVRQMRSSASLSDGVVHQYAMNMRRWLLFAGHLEERGGDLRRPSGRGAQMGLLRGRGARTRRFLGNGTPEGMTALVRKLCKHINGISETSLLADKLRNALYDAMALGVITRSQDRRIALAFSTTSPSDAIQRVKRMVLKQDSIRLISAALDSDPTSSISVLGDHLKGFFRADWKPTSAARYANGLRGYLTWASRSHQQIVS